MLFSLRGEAKQRRCNLSLCVLRYLSVSPHIRSDQGKTTDNSEDGSRHMQCRCTKYTIFVERELQEKKMKERFVLLNVFSPRAKFDLPREVEQTIFLAHDHVAVIHTVNERGKKQKISQFAFSTEKRSI